jgi:molecular chaperone GrpE
MNDQAPNDSNPPDNAPENSAESNVDAGQAVSTDIAQVQAELADARDKLLRLQAEMENLRRRTRREIEDERKYANLPLIRDLLPVLDNVGRALDAASKSKDVDTLISGMTLIAQNMQAALAKHGSTMIEAENQEFDPNVHEAILQQPSADHPPNTVMMVTQPGYKLHDRVIRPSQVIVSRAP